MRRDRKKKFKYIMLSTFALLSFTTMVVYAAVSSTLTISGNVNKKGGTWNIYLANPTVLSTTGSAKSERATVINDKKTLDISASLTEPGDSVSYTFSVINEGTIDAMLLAWNFVNATEYNALASKYNISTTLTYSNGSALKTNSDVLKAKGTSTMKLTFKYNGTEALTEEDVFLSIQIELLYGQLPVSSSE